MVFQGSRFHPRVSGADRVTKFRQGLEGFGVPLADSLKLQGGNIMTIMLPFVLAIRNLLSAKDRQRYRKQLMKKDEARTKRDENHLI